MTQVIDKPTQIAEFSTTLLDVCITSNPEKIIFSDVIHSGASDHSLIYVVRKIGATSKSNTTKEISLQNFEHFYGNKLRRSF